MEQQQIGRTPSSTEDQEDLGRAFAGQGSKSYGGDLGVSFEKHNASPELWVEHRRSHTWIWILVLLGLLLAAFLVYRLLSGGSSAATPAAGRRGAAGPAAITIGESKTGSINVYDNSLGTVTPLNTVTLYSQITGRVMSVHYREGQLVRKGDALVDIDPRPYQATLLQAKGSLQQAQGVLAQARIDLARYQAAFARNAIAKQQLDDQEQAVIQDEGTVQADQGTVQAAEVQLSYCHIVAPIAGRVGLRLVDPGNTVFSGSSSTLAVITQLQPITVVFNVAEDDLPAVQTELKAHHVLKVDAFDRANETSLESGKLTSLDNQIDTTTGTIKFRATFANPDTKLFPNQFVNARLLVRTLTNAVLVPSAAVQHNGTAAFVYVVTQGAPRQQPAPAADAGDKKKSAAPAQPAADATVEVHPVTVITSNENESAVDGIPAGAVLATSGFDRLENKSPVTVTKPGQHGQKGQTNTTSKPAGTPAS
jgi:multidrug efflux system membrane fusion protein